MIQDIIISSCIIFLSLALVPQIIQSFKTKKCDINIETAIITTLGLYIIAICFFTLGLYFSSIMDAITGTLWAIILMQIILYR